MLESVCLTVYSARCRGLWKGNERVHSFIIKSVLRARYTSFKR